MPLLYAGLTLFPCGLAQRRRVNTSLNPFVERYVPGQKQPMVKAADLGKVGVGAVPRSVLDGGVERQAELL